MVRKLIGMNVVRINVHILYNSSPRTLLTLFFNCVHVTVNNLIKFLFTIISMNNSDFFLLWLVNDKTHMLR